MIYLTKINNQEFVLNVDLIETIEETPDTIITLTNGHKLVVSETSNEIISKVINYRKKIYINNMS